MEPSRRIFLQGAAVGGAMLLPSIRQAAFARSAGHVNPFGLGVASGDPAPDGMVLWTRLAPQPTQPDWGMAPVPVPVRWEIAEDDGFARIVARGEEVARPELAHSVHAEVTGLKPGRPYWYRFIADGETSPVGRTRTTPPPGADVRSLRYAFSACQRFENGYYAAYRHMVADDPELIVFLGDYIYEQAARHDLPRRHPAEAAHDLATYRLRYATYRSDPDLQAAHAIAPWMMIWDDHEVLNNYRGGLPISGKNGAEFLLRRAAAYQAYYEHMPLRRGSMPHGPDMRIYRTLDWGRLAQFQFLDTRQYRSFTPCFAGAAESDVVPDCAERRDPTRSLLGAAQEKWLLDALATSPAKWNILAQQYVMAELKRRDPAGGSAALYSTDGWDANPVSRERILRTWVDAKTSNPHAIGGDMHSFAASDLRLTPDAPVVAAAFVGGTISSPGDEAKMVELKADNPDFRFASYQHGYTLVNVTPAATHLEYRALRDVTDPKSEAYQLAKFVMEDGAGGGGVHVG